VSHRHRSSWIPRRMALSSSSGSASRSAMRSCGSAPPATLRSGLRAVKTEPVSPPPTRGRITVALVIREGRGGGASRLRHAGGSGRRRRR
jgi:hypothetical protein